MNASPAMDTGAPLCVLGAEVELRSVRGTCRFPLKDLWAGPGRTHAEADELCVAIHLPRPADRSGSAIPPKISPGDGDRRGRRGRGGEPGGGRHGHRPGHRHHRRRPHSILSGRATGLVGVSADAAAEQAAAFAAAQATPISDVRASEAYRRHTASVMARRALLAAARRAGEHVPTPLNRTTGIGAAS